MVTLPSMSMVLNWLVSSSKPSVTFQDVLEKSSSVAFQEVHEIVDESSNAEQHAHGIQKEALSSRENSILIPCLPSHGANPDQRSGQKHECTDDEGLLGCK